MLTLQKELSLVQVRQSHRNLWQMDISDLIQALLIDFRAAAKCFRATGRHLFLYVDQAPVRKAPSSHLDFIGSTEIVD